MTFRSKASNAVCVQGHRGWRGKFPENSLVAFEAAHDLGICAIELDVVPGPENSLWVWHDPYLGSLFEGEHLSSIPLQQYTLRELSTTFFGLKAHPKFPNQQHVLCRLIQLKELINWWTQLGPERAWLNIEVKSRRAWEPLFQPAPEHYVHHLLDTLPKSVERLHLQSFDQRILDAIHAKNAAYSVGRLIESTTDLYDLVANAPQLDAVGIAHQLVNEETMRVLEPLGLEIMVWTVNDLAEANRLFALGIRNFITDFPQVLKKWALENGYALRHSLIG